LVSEGVDLLKNQFKNLFLWKEVDEKPGKHK